MRYFVFLFLFLLLNNPVSAGLSEKISVKISVPYNNKIVKKTINEQKSRFLGKSLIIKKYIRKNFEMIKIHGNKKSKNLIIGWGSTSGAIKDAIKDLDAKFLQVIYCKPLSPQIKKEIEKAEKVILVECNVTGQLGRLIREKTGIKIENRLLKYNSRPFHTDELNKLIKSIIWKIR